MNYSVKYEGDWWLFEIFPEMCWKD